jgi:ankyrin repeat protein
MDRVEGQLKDQKELAKQVLSWITCAKRPLTTLELQHALAIEVRDSELDKENMPEIEDMVSVCAGLVTIDEESGIIRLVSSTVEEYFQRTQKCWFPNAEINITIICVTYLSFSEFESGICQTENEFEERLQSNRLYEYAAHYWGHHAHKASTFIPEVISFLERKGQVEASCQALMATKQYSYNPGYSQHIPKQMTGLHLAAYFGVSKEVNDLLSHGYKPDSHDTFDRTPLSWAAENGHEAVVKLLLETDAEVNSEANDGQTPLSWAAENGHKNVAKLLLEKLANIDSKDHWGQTPLTRATKNGHEVVVKLLLDKGADTEANASDGRTPLSKATENGHEVVVKLLLDHRADIEAKASDGRTPLLWAATNGHGATVNLLLDHGADIKSKDEWGQTPLSRAAESGHEAVIKLLLDHGADIEAKAGDERTPLLWAATNGHVAVVKQLLDHEADIESKDQWGQTALSRAAENGHEAVVKLLLDHGADTEAKARDGRTPLLWASENEHDVVVKIILKVTVSSDGSASLHTALAGGHKNVVECLLANHFDSVAKGDFNWLPDLKDAGFEAADIASLLLETAKTEPWISLSDITASRSEVINDFHQICCAHKQNPTEAEQDPLFRPASFQIERESMHRIVTGSCGLGGVFPPSLDQVNGFSSVNFIGTKARVLFGDVGGESEVEDTLDAENSTIDMVPGFLSQLGKHANKVFRSHSKIQLIIRNYYNHRLLPWL